MPKRSTPRLEPVVRDPRRPERLAINLFDLELVHPAVRAKLLPLLDLRKESAAWVDRDRVEETGAPFACGLMTAALACDLVRGMARTVGEEVPKAYLDRRGRGSWERLPGAAVLTLVHAGKPVLNPELFPGAVAVEFKPLPAKRITL